MGNCCCCCGSQTEPGAFLGEGHRLGTADEARYRDDGPMHRGGGGGGGRGEDAVPEPVYDQNLTDEQRAKIRADRAAAAEARLKKQGIAAAAAKKKAADTSNKPLVGPNSQPTMRWTAG